MVGIISAAPALAASKHPCTVVPTLPTTAPSAYVRGTEGNGSPNGVKTNGDGISRWWEWVNNKVTSDVFDPSNYLTYTRTWVVNNVTANRNYTISGTLMANFGNNCTSCSRAAGIMLQTSTDGGSSWTTQATYVTRPNALPTSTSTSTSLATANATGTAESTPVPSTATTITWNGSTWNTWAAVSSTAPYFCDWCSFYNGGAYTQTPQNTATAKGLLYSDVMNYSFDVWSTGTLRIRYINFVQPISLNTCTATCSNPSYTNDDIGITDPTLSCWYG